MTKRQTVLKDFELGMRRAAEIADMYADENMRMADDTIQLAHAAKDIANAIRIALGETIEE